MPSVTVRLFARAKDLAGTERAEVGLAIGATVGDLRSVLAESYPELGGFLRRCAIAVNGDFAEDSDWIPFDGEVAILPPVSGG